MVVVVPMRPGEVGTAADWVNIESPPPPETSGPGNLFSTGRGGFGGFGSLMEIAESSFLRG